MTLAGKNCNIHFIMNQERSGLPKRTPVETQAALNAGIAIGVAHELFSRRGFRIRPWSDGNTLVEFTSRGLYKNIELMPGATGIGVEGKAKNLYHLEFENGEAMYVTQEFLVQNHLPVGDNYYEGNVHRELKAIVREIYLQVSLADKKSLKTIKIDFQHPAEPNHTIVEQIYPKAPEEVEK